MALDTSIPLQVRPAQIESPQNVLMNAVRLQAAQGQLADQQRMTTERNALADVLRQGQVFDAQGQLTPGGLGQVAQAAPSQVPAYAQLANQQQRLNRQDELQGVGLAMRKQQWAQQGFATAATPEAARQYIQSGVSAGILTPEEAQRGLAQVPADQASFDQWRNQINQSMMTPAQRAELERGTYSAPVQTNQGFAQIDRNGNVRIPTGPNGQPLMPVTLDAAGQGAAAQAKAYGTAQGKAQAANQQEFGQAEATANQIMGVIDQAINHPGRGYATGASSMLPIIPGTDAADFNAVLDQIKGQAFLQAFESLKGGGQITEVEGTKATQAIARLERSQSEAEFVKSLQELRSIVANGLERARRKAGAAAAPATGAATSAGPAREVARRGRLPDGRQVVEYKDGTREVIQ
ncbi:hypothetical protein [Achromobacter sp. NFACC18-2]|uniref:hypothetical protein n=1 Tax=Achromobacter sp. NFACC18-2 TaxID=1564112 RepID=UPI0008BD9CC7|nr:hypothetical protein [Achromobacter sp. NFACC18-2]SEK00086.1 hypothetical protein SAMN03159494_04265 [Achromobacter sp. NFACC18-2]